MYSNHTFQGTTIGPSSYHLWEGVTSPQIGNSVAHCAYVWLHVVVGSRHVILRQREVNVILAGGCL